MTKRIVSLFGAAGVAAMVMLAGCSDGPGAVDHTAALDGTWAVTTMATVPNPAGTPPTIDLPAAVAATIVDGPGVNTGTFSLMVTVTSPLGAVVTTGSGTLKAESASVLKVTLDEIMSEGIVPDAVTALKGVEQTVNYELMDDMLTISSDLFATLGVGMELTLTKQMAST